MKVFVSSVMRETWQERAIARRLLAEHGHTPLLKANYENGPGAPETLYHPEPTAELIDKCEFFLMIPRLSYGLTTATGRSMSHDELVVAQRARKLGLAMGVPAGSHGDAETSQRQLLQQLSAYLGPAFKQYSSVAEFELQLRSLLQSDLRAFGVPLLPNRVFISHSSNDKGFVEGLASDLFRSGFDVWYDKFDIAVGDPLLSTIQTGIEQSAFVVLVLSPDSVSSDWVRTEIELAIALEEHWKHKVLLPVRCRPFAWPERLGQLSGLKYADFTGQWDVALRELIASLRGYS